MSKTHLILPDPHSHPDYNNDRFDLVGKLMLDLKPDVFINMGDHADLASLSLYDKGKSSFHGRNYAKDIEAALDANERIFGPTKKAKKKKPRSIILEGNHEHRIKKLLEVDPHLSGSKFGVSFGDLGYKEHYHDIVEYEGSTPGSILVDGINYAHFVISGVSGRAYSSMHHAKGLTLTQHNSTVVGHSHLFDYCINRDMTGKAKMGLVAGVFQDYDSGWAGKINNLWNRGLVILRNVENGVGDVEWVSLERLRKEYS